MTTHSARRLAPILIASMVTACRADVEGTWQGVIGFEPATLWLEQRGGAIGGDACVGDNCAVIDVGVLEDDHLQLDFGCAACALVDTSLDLTLSGEALHGTAQLIRCACPQDDPQCTCRPDAHLSRCASPCGSRHDTDTSFGGQGGSDPSAGGSP